MQTIQGKLDAIAASTKMFQDIDFQNVELFNANLFEVANNEMELRKLLTRRRFVLLQDSNEIVPVNPDMEFLPDGLYGMGKDGEPYEVLLGEVLLATSIAQATGASLSQITNAQQVIDYVQEQKVSSMTKLGDGILENAQYGDGYPVDLLPADGQVNPDTTYWAIADAGSTIGGELLDRTGWVYGVPSDNTHAGITWRVIDPFDGLSTTELVEEGNASLVTSRGVFTFVEAIQTTINNQIAAIQGEIQEVRGEVSMNGSAIGANSNEIARVGGEVATISSSLPTLSKNEVSQLILIGEDNYLASESRVFLEPLPTIKHPSRVFIADADGRNPSRVDAPSLALTNGTIAFNVSKSIDLTGKAIIVIGSAR